MDDLRQLNVPAIFPPKPHPHHFYFAKQTLKKITETEYVCVCVFVFVFVCVCVFSSSFFYLMSVHTIMILDRFNIVSCLIVIK